MAAVLGMSGDQVEHVLNARENVFVANYNCPGQIVITGKKDAVLQAGEALLSHGAKRVLPLKVSGPFHSPFLQEAGNRLEETLREILWKELRIPYITNVTAAPVLETDKIQELLVRQVASPVRWQQSMERMIADGVDTFIEIGPGKTLTGFLRKINRNVTSYNISTWDELEKTMEILIEE